MPMGIERITGTEAKRVWGELSELAIGRDLQRRPEPDVGGSFGGELFAPGRIGVESA